MDQPVVYVTFSGWQPIPPSETVPEAISAGPNGSPRARRAATRTFGPYTSASIEPADHDCTILLLLVSASGQDPADEDGDGHCLAAWEEKCWKLANGMGGEEQDGPLYTRLSVHQKL